MKFGLYYVTVFVFFCCILFSVRYIVNANRIIIGTEEIINPTEIFWDVNPSDSLLRVKEPLFLDKTFILSKHQVKKYKQDSIIYAELYEDTIPNKGALINMQPPFIMWKTKKNDTIKVYKNGMSLNFVKYQSALRKKK